MAEWRIVGRREDKDGDGARLVFVCERDGRTREAVVSATSWATKRDGDTIRLADDEPTSLVVAGVVVKKEEWRTSAGRTTRDAYYVVLQPFRGASVGRVEASKELYEKLVEAGVRRLTG